MGLPDGGPIVVGGYKAIAGQSIFRYTEIMT